MDVGEAADLVSDDEFKWMDFFRSAGVPTMHAESYADVFEDNRITEEMIPDLTIDILQAMGVAVMGDVIAILKRCKQTIAEKDKEEKARQAREAKAKAKRDNAVALLKKKSDARAAREAAASKSADALKQTSRKRKTEVVSEDDETEGGTVSVEESNDSASYYVDENGNTKQVRRVPRHEEGNYIVTLPSKAKRNVARTVSTGSIFDRMTGPNKISKSRNQKVRVVDMEDDNKNDDNGIFSRLGSGKRNNKHSARRITISPNAKFQSGIHSRIGT